MRCANYLEHLQCLEHILTVKNLLQTFVKCIQNLPPVPIRTDLMFEPTNKNYILTDQSGVD